LGDGKSISEAKIVFMNDLNDEFEPWLEPLLKRVKFRRHQNNRQQGRETYSSSEERAPRNKAAEEEIDQHAWLDPKNGVIYVRNIAAALAKSDPANAADYHARAAAYIKELQDLDAWAKAEMAAVPPAKRRILSSHDSLQYLAKAYRHYVAVDQWLDKQQRAVRRPAGESRSKDTAGAPYARCSSTASPIRVRCSRCPNETGAAIGGTLYGDALSKPGEEADTYVKMIRHDVTTLVAGMMKN